MRLHRETLGRIERRFAPHFCQSLVNPTAHVCPLPGQSKAPEQSRQHSHGEGATAEAEQEQLIPRLIEANQLLHSFGNIAGQAGSECKAGDLCQPTEYQWGAPWRRQDSHMTWIDRFECPRTFDFVFVNASQSCPHTIVPNGVLLEVVAWCLAQYDQVQHLSDVRWCGVRTRSRFLP